MGRAKEKEFFGGNSNDYLLVGLVTYNNWGRGQNLVLKFCFLMGGKEVDNLFTNDF